MPTWKPRAVRPSITLPAGRALVELDDAPSPLHDAIRAYLDKTER